MGSLRGGREDEGASDHHGDGRRWEGERFNLERSLWELEP